MRIFLGEEGINEKQFRKKNQDCHDYKLCLETLLFGGL